MFHLGLADVVAQSVRAFGSATDLTRKKGSKSSTATGVSATGHRTIING